VLRFLLRLFYGLRRASHAPAPPAAPVSGDARAHAPWAREVLAALGGRYRLGEETPDGTQVLCRVARARFNPMRVWLRAAERAVAGDYDVRVHGGRSLDDGRALLDREVGAALAVWGLRAGRESVEEWAGHVITRRYEGMGLGAATAARAVHFMCQESAQAMDVDQQ
jgi:hypothetical protein